MFNVTVDVKHATLPKCDCLLLIAGCNNKSTCTTVATATTMGTVFELGMFVSVEYAT